MTNNKYFVLFTSVTLSNENWITPPGYYSNYFNTSFIKYKAKLCNGSYIPDLSNGEVFNNVEVKITQSKGYFKQKNDPESFFNGVINISGVYINFKDPDSRDTNYMYLVHGSIKIFNPENN